MLHIFRYLLPVRVQFYIDNERELNLRNMLKLSASLL